MKEVCVDTFGVAMVLEDVVVVAMGVKSFSARGCDVKGSIPPFSDSLVRRRFLEQTYPDGVTTMGMSVGIGLPDMAQMNVDICDMIVFVC